MWLSLGMRKQTTADLFSRESTHVYRLERSSILEAHWSIFQDDHTIVCGGSVPKACTPKHLCLYPLWMPWTPASPQSLYVISATAAPSIESKAGANGPVRTHQSEPIQSLPTDTRPSDAFDKVSKCRNLLHHTYSSGGQPLVPSWLRIRDTACVADA